MLACWRLGVYFIYSRFLHVAKSRTEGALKVSGWFAGVSGSRVPCLVSRVRRPQLVAPGWLPKGAVDTLAPFISPCELLPAAPITTEQ